MDIAIFGNTYRKETAIQVIHVIRFLESRQNVNIRVEPELHMAIKEQISPVCKPFCPGEESLPDIALSIGGDGTFLTTASKIGDKNIPILGINGGRLGFLADVSWNEVETVLQDVVNNNYTIEQRSVLQVIASDNSCKGYPFGLNEVAVLKQDLSSMISVDTFINDEHVHTYQADGLIIATPTGSTAYNMSVGGPLLVPQTKNLIISPVASHSLNVRPLVIPDDWEIRLKIHSRSHCFLVSIDGRSQIMQQETELTIKKAPYTIKVIKPAEHSFFQSLKNKLMWGMDKRINDN